MSAIARRIERAEKTLSMEQEPVVCGIIHFGGGPLPPEERRGNVVVRHVAYETIQARREGGAGHEH